MPQKGQVFTEGNRSYKLKNYRIEELDGEPTIYWDTDYIDTSAEKYVYGTESVLDDYIMANMSAGEEDAFEALRSEVKQQISSGE